ncbi:MAG: hypothetical protein ACKVJG_22140 [Candidatus Latescibacterota bacterium]
MPDGLVEHAVYLWGVRVYSNRLYAALGRRFVVGASRCGETHQGSAEQ